VDCGKTDFFFLEFDHVKGEKISEVSHMQTKSSILVESAKTELRCIECHREERRSKIQQTAI